MNIFLCGIPGVGKSTIVRKILKDFNIIPSGFITLSGSAKEGGFPNVYIHPANKFVVLENNANMVGQRLGNGNYKAFPEVFEKIGMDILNNVYPPLIVMDELGFMEKDALNFQNKILEILDQDIPILGAIKYRDNPFLQSIKEHPKSFIINVDKTNRDEAYQIVKSRLEDQFNKV